MNNYNKVFRVIKKQCQADDPTNKTVCFEAISDELHMRPEGIEFYIHSLSEIGLVSYSQEEKTVSLTSAGKKESGFLFNLVCHVAWVC
jgi:Mn-dependent DtxR family transcriptional regulator